MKKFKRLLATVSVVLCMSMVLGMGSVAASGGERAEINIRTISLDQIPENITPIEFSSDEEMYQFAQSFVEAINDKNDTECPSIEPRACFYHPQGHSSYSTKKTVSALPIFELKLTTDFYIQCLDTSPTYPHNIKNRTISDAQLSLAVIGIVVGLDIRPTSEYVNIDDDNRGFHSYSRGDIDIYFLVEGLGKVLSTTYFIEHTYKV